MGTEHNASNAEFLYQLQALIDERKEAAPENSYTASLFKEGIDRILQKVGEESVEYLLAAKNTDQERTISECADLLYHLLVSLSAKNLSINDVIQELHKRHSK